MYLVGFGKSKKLTKEDKAILKELMKDPDEPVKKRGRPKKHITQKEINKINKRTNYDIKKIARNYDVKLEPVNISNKNIEYLTQHLQLDNKQIYPYIVEISELADLYEMQLNAGFDNKLLKKNILDYINKCYDMATPNDIEKLKVIFQNRLKYFN
jgi:glutamine synthetase adenylyltransferase